ncbi:hypothetical protein Vafri_16129, partial [Volvox africanus]
GSGAASRSTAPPPPAPSMPPPPPLPPQSQRQQQLQPALPMMPQLPPLSSAPPLKSSGLTPAMSYSTHQPSRFAPKGTGDSPRPMSPVGSTPPLSPSPWSTSPTAAATAAVTSPPSPTSAVPTELPPLSLAGNNSDAEAGRDGVNADVSGGDGGGVGGGQRPQTPVTSPSRSSDDFRKASTQRRLKQSALMASGDQQVSVEVITSNPITSDLELDDLIQAISRSSSSFPIGNPDGSRQGTGTGSGSYPSESPHRGAAAGGGGCGGSALRRMTSGGDSSVGDAAGATLQVIVRRRSCEQLSVGSSRVSLAVEVQKGAVEEICPLETLTPSQVRLQPFELQPQSSTLLHPQQPSQQAPNPLSQPPSQQQQHRHQDAPLAFTATAARSGPRPGGEDGKITTALAPRGQSSMSPTQSSPSLPLPPALQQQPGRTSVSPGAVKMAKADGSSGSGGAAAAMMTSSRDLDPITENPSTELALVSAAKSVRVGGGGGN